MPTHADAALEGGPRVPLSALSDDALVAGIREASEPHFNELYTRYFQRIYNFTYLRVRNHADTEEIVQEVFTAAYRSIDAWSGRSSLLAWIYGIAKNTVNNHLRRQRNQEDKLEKAQPELARAEAPLAAFTPEEQLQLRRYADRVNRQLESVSTWQREVFLLRHVENLPIREIARRTRRSSDAVRSSLYRVKRLLVEASEAEPLVASS